MQLNENELRKLDAEIAQLVFGWTVKSRQCPHSGSVTEHFWYEAGNDIKPSLECSTQRMFPSGTIVGINCPEEIPHYSTNSAHASEVMKACGKITSIAFHLGTTNEWWMGDLNKKSRWASAETFELCAALFAKKLFSTKTK